MLAMPEQEYIKYLYEEEECSIAEISAKLGINWRTAAKYAKKDNWNEACMISRGCQPVMDPVAEVIDMWLMEDRLKPRKERRTAAAIYRQLKDQYNFTGSERTVRHYVPSSTVHRQTVAQKPWRQRCSGFAVLAACY
ncbi:MAG: hypothetical protein D9V47_02465 [Clostridia bacterium]|nr:MAG: hypothetical protein D9V47_02465 [Clostridia bacterium]